MDYRDDAARRERRIEVPGRRSGRSAWPSRVRGRPDTKPILTLRGRLFESSVMDGLVADEYDHGGGPPATCRCAEGADLPGIEPALVSAAVLTYMKLNDRWFGPCRPFARRASAFVVVDWGTSSFRGVADVGADGEALAGKPRRHTHCACGDGGCAPVPRDHLARLGVQPERPS